jgi:hypothetical protein
MYMYTFSSSVGPSHGNQETLSATDGLNSLTRIEEPVDGGKMDRAPVFPTSLDHRQIQTASTNNMCAMKDEQKIIFRRLCTRLVLVNEPGNEQFRRKLYQAIQSDTEKLMIWNAQEPNEFQQHVSTEMKTRSIGYLEKLSSGLNAFLSNDRTFRMEVAEKSWIQTLHLLRDVFEAESSTGQFVSLRTMTVDAMITHYSDADYADALREPDWALRQSKLKPLEDILTLAGGFHDAPVQRLAVCKLRQILNSVPDLITLGRLESVLFRLKRNIVSILRRAEPETSWKSLFDERRKQLHQVVDRILVEYENAPDCEAGEMRREAVSRIRQNLSNPDWPAVYLQGLKLTRLPDIFGFFTSVSDVRLQDNRLVALPESLGRYMPSSHLDLSGNLLTSLPDWIWGRTSFLILQDNQIEEVSDLAIFATRAVAINFDYSINLASNPLAVERINELKQAARQSEGGRVKLQFSRYGWEG